MIQQSIEHVGQQLGNIVVDLNYHEWKNFVIVDEKLDLNYHEWKNINQNLLQISKDICNKFLVPELYQTIYTFIRLPSSRIIINNNNYNKYLEDVCIIIANKFKSKDSFNIGLILCQFIGKKTFIVGLVAWVLSYTNSSISKYL